MPKSALFWFWNDHFWTRVIIFKLRDLENGQELAQSKWKRPRKHNFQWRQWARISNFDLSFAKIDFPCLRQRFLASRKYQRLTKIELESSRSKKSKMWLTGAIGNGLKSKNLAGIFLGVARCWDLEHQFFARGWTEFGSESDFDVLQNPWNLTMLATLLWVVLVVLAGGVITWNRLMYALTSLNWNWG